MSSAASNAAAKRRRGAQGGPPPPKSTRNNQTNSRGRVPTLAEIAVMHEQRLRALEGGNSSNDTNSVLPEMVPQTVFEGVVGSLNQQIGELKDMVQALQSNVLSNSATINSVKKDAVQEVSAELDALDVNDGDSKSKKKATKSTTNNQN